MINNSELKTLQKLAKINYSKAEEEVFITKLGSIIAMIDQLQDIDCNHIEPLYSVISQHQRMTNDQAVECEISEALFNNVPKQEAELAKEVKYFVVPKVVE